MKSVTTSESTSSDGTTAEADGLLNRPVAAALSGMPPANAGVVVGELLAITDDGHTPLVTYPGQPGTAALRARSVVDVRGEQIGKQVVLAFENSDALLPIVMGVLRSRDSQPLVAPGQVHVDADGERMVVTASEQLVLRCGKASITLTNAGKIIIDGSYVVSRASGTNRIKGGSVQLN